MQVGIRNLRLLFPLVAGLHHASDTRPAHAVDAAENTGRRQFTSLLRAVAFLQQDFLRRQIPFRHRIPAFVGGLRCQNDSPLQQFQTGSRQIAELAGGLHHHIHAGAAQFLFRNQTYVEHPSETVANRLNPQQIKNLPQSRTLALDETSRPKREAHLRRQFAMVLGIIGQHLLRHLLAFLPSRRARGSLGIDRIQVPSCRQGRRIGQEIPARSRRHIASLQCIQHRGHLRLGTVAQSFPVEIHFPQGRFQMAHRLGELNLSGAQPPLSVNGCPARPGSRIHRLGILGRSRFHPGPHPLCLFPLASQRVIFRSHAHAQNQIPDIGLRIPQEFLHRRFRWFVIPRSEPRLVFQLSSFHLALGYVHFRQIECYRILRHQTHRTQNLVLCKWHAQGI